MMQDAGHHSMKLTFQSLAITNFGTFKKEQVIDLALQPGVHYVRGSNELEPDLGANDVGKSTIWKALLWCLYGKTADNLKNTDVRSWQCSGPTAVTLVFSVDDKSHKLLRTTGPNKLLLNGKPAAQEQIEHLVGLSFDLFIFTILHPQGRRLFLDLDPREKMRIFSDTLQLELWDRRSKAASDRVGVLLQKQAGSEGKLTGLKGALAELQKLEADTERLSAQWEEGRQDALIGNAAKITQHKKTLEKLERKANDANLATDSAGTEAKALRNQIDKLQNEQITLERSLAKAQGQQSTCNDKITRLQRELTSLQQSKHCPTCGQIVKPANLATHKAELAADLQAAQNLLKDFDRHITSINKSVQEIDATITRANKAYREFLDKEEQAQTILNSCQPQVSELQAAINSLREQTETLQQGNNPHLEQKRLLKKQRLSTAVEITELTEDLTKLGRQTERTKFWVKGFKDVQLHIIQDVLQELELNSAVILPELGLADWAIKYAIERETKSGTIKPGLNTTVLSPYNDNAVRWEVWGGGVSQRLRIAGALSLSEVLLNRAGVTTDLEILDEPSKGLSAEGIEDLIEALADRAQQLDKVIFLVDHRLFESSRFSSVLTVAKTKHGSMISKG
jgi:DNA repair exonuclease SbcCD ATPase subunit